MLLRCGLVVVALATPGLVAAQQPTPPGMGLAAAAAKRFPQPVRVQDLLGRTVLQPEESQTLLGRVTGVARAKDGQVVVVMAYGGVLGLGTRPIAVPVDAMVLLGQAMEVMDFTPAQLDGFAAFNPAAFTALGADEVIRVGLARPSH